MKKYLIFLLFPIIILASNRNSILRAVKTDDLVLFKILEKEEKKLDIKDEVMGKNLLGYAIYYDASLVAKYLIDNHKYMINQIADDNTTALEVAVLRENEEILKKLLDNGAIIRKDEIYTLATKYGKGRMVKVLRDYMLKRK